MAQLFADIILPVAVRGHLTYSIPDEMSHNIIPGQKVTVQLGNRKLYSGIVSRIHSKSPELKSIRPIFALSGSLPLVNDKQLKFWQWISEYYMCCEGEVMNAAIPSVLLPEGFTESLPEEKYKPKTESFLQLARQFSEDELNEILDKMGRAPGQSVILNRYLLLTGYCNGRKSEPVNKGLLLKTSGASQAALSALVRKGILNQFYLEVDRIIEEFSPKESLKILSEAQERAYKSISENFSSREIVLLHGITSSGKTEIYIHLIEEQLKKGKQVLYLLPEIALTGQIISRLQKHFGPVTGVYHSKFSDNEKAEIWNRVSGTESTNSYRLILGVRSSIFLPFSNLGLVIVDEEHDGSYKQQDPAPRYHARDCAIILAGMHGAKTLLGSASPSIESYHNAGTGKYGLVELMERYGQIKLPEIILANTREAYRKKLMVSHFTPELLNAMDGALGRNEQIILFQNRRGFSPYVECSECGWIPVCNNCAVNLTYHKVISRLVCHYCGFTTSVNSKCGNCSSSGLVTKGFGTEKIEDEVRLIFPEARIGRLDQDTARSRKEFGKVIKAFEEQRTDILIGTQMISKGLDFENLTVVGILNADNLLNFPDFRAYERSFQLMEQVSGRAGRRKKVGKVVIQTSDPSNRIIRLVLRHDYQGMYRMQAEERKNFNYPPFCRMIKLNLKHRERAALNHFAGLLGDDLKGFFGKRVLGPEFPVISRIQSWYIKTILLKIEKDKSLSKVREYISSAIGRIEKEKGSSSLRISIDVDPV